jgi:hypothetical protein
VIKIRIRDGDLGGMNKAGTCETEGAQQQVLVKHVSLQLAGKLAF